MLYKNVLIVDDDEVVANLEKEILEGEGFQVRVAKNGVEGLKKIKQNGHDTYDAIVSDLEMPRMKGDEFYLEVKKLGQNLEKKMIFVSGSINDFIKSTGNRFLTKPFSPQQLIESVEDLIESDA